MCNRTNTRQTGSVMVSIRPSYDKLETTAAAATSDEIVYNYTITNNGLLSLYDISIEGSGLHEKGVYITCTDVDSLAVPGVGHGAVTGLATYIDNKGLAPAASLTCSAKDGVTQAEVRNESVEWCPTLNRAVRRRMDCTTTCTFHRSEHHTLLFCVSRFALQNRRSEE